MNDNILSFSTTIDTAGFENSLRVMDQKWQDAKKKVEEKGLMVRLGFDLAKVNTDFDNLIRKLSQKSLTLKVRLDTSEVEQQLNYLGGKGLVLSSNGGRSNGGVRYLPSPGNSSSDYDFEGEATSSNSQAQQAFQNAQTINIPNATNGGGNNYGGGFGGGGGGNPGNPNNPNNNRANPLRPFLRQISRYGIGIEAIRIAGQIAGAQNEFNRQEAMIGTPGYTGINILENNLNRNNSVLGSVPFIGTSAAQLRDLYQGESKSIAQADAAYKKETYFTNSRAEIFQNQRKALATIASSENNFEGSRQGVSLNFDAIKNQITTDSLLKQRDTQSQIDTLKSGITPTRLVLAKLGLFGQANSIHEDLSNINSLGQDLGIQKNQEQKQLNIQKSLETNQLMQINRQERGEIGSQAFTLAASNSQGLSTTASAVNGIKAQFFAAQNNLLVQGANGQWTLPEGARGQSQRLTEQMNAQIGAVNRVAEMDSGFQLNALNANSFTIAAQNKVALGGGFSAQREVSKRTLGEAMVEQQKVYAQTIGGTTADNLARQAADQQLRNANLRVQGEIAASYREQYFDSYNRQSDVKQMQAEQTGNNSTAAREKIENWRVNQLKNNPDNADQINAQANQMKIGVDIDVQKFRVGTALQAGQMNLSARQQELMNQFKPLTANVEGIEGNAELSIQNILAQNPGTDPEVVERRNKLIEATNRGAQAQLKGFDNQMKYSYHGTSVSAGEFYGHGRAFYRGQSQSNDYSSALGEAARAKRTIQDMAIKGENQKGIDPKDAKAMVGYLKDIAEKITKLLGAH